MSDSKNTTVVLVPGSFSPAFFYDEVAKSLKALGVESVIVPLPSVGRRDPAKPATMSEDALAIAAAVTEVAAAGKQVVIVAHSYGGVPASQSIQKISESSQAKAAVRRLVYLSALVPQLGQSTVAFMGQLPDFLTVHDDYIKQDPTENAKLTLSDLPPDEALKWAKQMPEHSTPSFQEGLGYAGYKDVEVGYIVLENDLIIPLAYQEGMIKFLEDGEGKKVEVHRLQSGHAPNASQPDKLGEVIQRIVNNS